MSLWPEFMGEMRDSDRIREKGTRAISGVESTELGDLLGEEQRISGNMEEW